MTRTIIRRYEFSWVEVIELMSEALVARNFQAPPKPDDATKEVQPNSLTITWEEVL